MTPHVEHPSNKRPMSWSRLWAVAALLGSLGTLGATSSSEEYLSPPVLALQQALKAPVLQPKLKEDRDFRTEQIKAALDKIKNLGDMRRGLMLQEWRDLDRVEDVASIDAPLRKILVDRFTGDLHKALESPHTDTRLAAVAMLGDMGTSMRGGGDSKTWLARDFAPDLVRLIKDDKVDIIRQGSARSLGKINPVRLGGGGLDDPDKKKPEPKADEWGPKLATDALAGLLAHQQNLGDRRAAVDGLANLVRVLYQLRKGGQASSPAIEMSRDQETLMSTLVATAVAPALRDSDEKVRMTGLETVKICASMLKELVGNPPRQEFPPPGRPLTAEERTEIERYMKIVEIERQELSGLAEAIAPYPTVIAGSFLVSPDASVRLQAINTLGEIGFARLRILRKIESIPPLAAKVERKEIQEILGPALNKVVPAMVARVKDPSPDVRLAAVEALINIDDLARPFTPVFVRSLRDPNLFVRWASTRLLGRIQTQGQTGTEQPTDAVTGLIPLLNDTDLDVRMAAAAALEIYGDASIPAIDPLAKQVNQGDVEMRVRAMRTLASVGPRRPDAFTIKSLGDALGYEDPRVRKAAAEALGQYGPSAVAAADKLKTALDDSDEDVRRAAEDALSAVKP